jgi:hypothetical protein
MDTLVIYHGGCADGTAAAHILAMGLGDSVYLYGSFNRDFSKNAGLPPVDGRRVYILDYCFDSASLARVAETAASLHILDHHETNLRMLCTKPADKLVVDYTGEHESVKLVGKCPISIYIDVALCATEIVAIVCRNKPWYVQHIRDRDLHLWDADPPVPYDRRSKAFGEALYELGISDETFAELDTYDDDKKSRDVRTRARTSRP